MKLIATAHISFLFVKNIYLKISNIRTDASIFYAWMVFAYQHACHLYLFQHVPHVSKLLGLVATSYRLDLCWQGSVPSSHAKKWILIWSRSKTRKRKLLLRMNWVSEMQQACSKWWCDMYVRHDDRIISVCSVTNHVAFFHTMPIVPSHSRCTQYSVTWSIVVASISS